MTHPYGRFGFKRPPAAGPPPWMIEELERMRREDDAGQAPAQLEIPSQLPLDDTPEGDAEAPAPSKRGIIILDI